MVLFLSFKQFFNMRPSVFIFYFPTVKVGKIMQYSKKQSNNRLRIERKPPCSQNGLTIIKGTLKPKPDVISKTIKKRVLNLSPPDKNQSLRNFPKHPEQEGIKKSPVSGAYVTHFRHVRKWKRLPSRVGDFWRAGKSALPAETEVSRNRNMQVDSIKISILNRVNSV